jgi:hypothetical protein
MEWMLDLLMPSRQEMFVITKHLEEKLYKTYILHLVGYYTVIYQITQGMNNIKFSIKFKK